MFGYLQIDKAELKVREYEAYKSVYCGLCKQLGRDYSVFRAFCPQLRLYLLRNYFDVAAQELQRF